MLGEFEDRGLGVGDADSIGPCGEDGQRASGTNPGRCSGERGGHVVYGAEGDDVEGAGFGHGFDPGGPDFGLEAQGPNDLAEEGGFFVLGFGEGDLQVWEEKLDGEAGEAGSAAEVQQGCGRGRWGAVKRLSPKWRRTISWGSRMAVRLVRAFHLRRRSR